MPEQLRPSRAQTVTEDEVEALVHGICFKTGPPTRLGVELEWVLHDLHDPAQPLHPARLTAVTEGLRTLPLRSALTFEPGGQLELSSRPASSLTSCVQEMAEDLSAVRAFLAPMGLGIAGHGHDPWRPPRRLLDLPRYHAMESYLDRWGPAGRTMMCRSASVQVCLDAGHEEPGPLGYGRRWRLAHLLGAVLVAAFANSPLDQGRPTGWRSTRQAAWAAMDPGRTQAPATDAEPRAAWTAYVLQAPVMCIRGTDGGTGPWEVPVDELRLRDWVRDGRPRPPSLEDVTYHISTLFPPVRPRGHLELRMIDAQPGVDGWMVPLAVTAALFDDPAAAEAAYRAVKPLGDTAGVAPAPRNPLWERAAQRGLTDPELHAAAVACFAAAEEALPRIGATPEVCAAVAEFRARYVARGRCPADDLLDSLSGKEGRS
ncbi:ergothioneine biosynthesis glutamate--cysteine ligase EgtA [Streptomyces sp. AC563]|uniref:ergothioneine biosynthesis glutamate--cysteine ligase EgtA n=1 Tax=Streptomyces buecherae TaxID=2763006 RepID=UPI00164E39AC|nr:ergothioneine biosynthesis glutamate--cysteine ligase EgtA [Streptomyces buecherae]MBC3991458.1 ergothioneine biosynthesis glutamate--cysteine ligase EgtA [Streptomyces buecherae]